MSNLATHQKVIKNKLGVLKLAETIGNVSQACKMMGSSRDSLYRYKELYETGGELALQDRLHDKVIPWFAKQDVRGLRVLTDCGTEYCGASEYHEYELYLAIEDIDHSRTKAKHSQTNGICERFHQTIQNEFYAIAFRKKVFKTIEELQEDADKWVNEHNNDRTHTGKYCFVKTLLQTFLKSKHLAQEKMLDKLQPTDLACVR